MKTKKFVLVIVEGPSDEDSLGVILNKLLATDEVHVHVVHGDITADFSTNSGNVIRRVNDIIRSCNERYRLRNTDYRCVIHVMDTDGAFIPGESVREEPALTDTVYSTTEILAPNRRRIVDRNARKSANMDKLAGTPSIAGIPYVPVYMSCNLDHVLHGKLNSTDSDKRRDSLAFARRYRNDIPAFVEFISHSDFSVPATGGRRGSISRKGCTRWSATPISGSACRDAGRV